MNVLLDIQSLDVPISLIEKPSNFDVSLGIILFVAFCVLAFARLSRPSLFKDLFLSWFKIQNLSAYLKESLPLNKRASLFLILNYFISGSVLLFLKLNEFNLEILDQVLFAALIPIGLVLIGLLALLITGWITGESRVLREPMYMRIIGIEISGLLFFIGAAVWMLNIDLVQYVWQGAILVFCLEFVSRVIKSVTIVSVNGVSWFYIILYLCTLEILPLFVAYYLIAKNFGLI